MSTNLPVGTPPPPHLTNLKCNSFSNKGLEDWNSKCKIYLYLVLKKEREKNCIYGIYFFSPIIFSIASSSSASSASAWSNRRRRSWSALSTHFHYRDSRLPHHHHHEYERHRHTLGNNVSTAALHNEYDFVSFAFFTHNTHTRQWTENQYLSRFLSTFLPLPQLGQGTSKKKPHLNESYHGERYKRASQNRLIRGIFFFFWLHIFLLSSMPEKKREREPEHTGPFSEY